MTKKVLIVDDDVDLLDMTCLVLEKDGHQVTILENPTKILQVVKDFEPSVILIDLWMPEVQGDEAIKILKNDKSTQDIPVILFSAYPKLKDIATNLDVSYLSKPFDLHELRERVRNC